MIIDIGVNLTNAQFQNDIDDVVSNAVAANVTKMIITGTNIEQSVLAQQLTMQYHDVLYSTAGIHPHDASSFTPNSILQLKHLLEQKNVVAIGECGLDFNRNYSTPAEQLSCFEAQLELAVEKQLPVFLHQRDASDVFLSLIREYRSGLVDAVVHCFTGGQEELEACLNEDLHIGITGWLCDERRGKHLQDCVKLIPLDRVMIETDAPFLYPRDLKSQPHTASKRKKRNEPQFLPHILKRLAYFMNVDEHELAQLTSSNSKRFFRL